MSFQLSLFRVGQIQEYERAISGKVTQMSRTETSLSLTHSFMSTTSNQHATNNKREPPNLNLLSSDYSENIRINSVVCTVSADTSKLSWGLQHG